MKKDYLITIDGRHTAGDNTENISLSTLGSYSRRNGVDYIIYKETEATGYEGDVTTLMVENQHRATITRSGKTKSHLVIEKGQKHMCHYDTGYGSINIGILAEKIDNSLAMEGGEVRLRYALDLNASTISVNELTITVKENQPHA
jgi:uncharacterized beta-barrel protein YwiB (DUF1934 family)